MSGYHTADRRVSQADIDRWNNAMNASSSATATIESLRVQTQNAMNRQAESTAQMQRRLQAQEQRMNASFDRINTNLSSLSETQSALADTVRAQNEAQRRFRTETLTRFRQQEEELGGMIRDVQGNVENLSETMRQNQQSVNRKIQEVAFSVGDLENRLTKEIRDSQEELSVRISQEIDEKIEVMNVRIMGILDGYGIDIRDLKGDMNDLKARMLKAEDNIDAVQRDLAIIMEERQNAINMAQEMERTYELLYEDLYSNHNCDAFCPGELLNLKDQYVSARLIQANGGVDPSVTLNNFNSLVRETLNLRSRVMHQESRFEEIKYQYLDILNYYEAVSGVDYYVPTIQEGTLFNLNENSNHELEHFRNRIAVLRAQIESPSSNIETLTNIRAEIQSLENDYAGILHRATLYEAALEECINQINQIAINLINSGFHYEVATRNEDNNMCRVICRCAGGDGLYNQIVVDATPYVGIDSETGEPAPRYRYSYRVFVRDSEGNFYRDYDEAMVHSALAIVSEVTGCRLDTVAGYENEAVGAKEYEEAGIAETYNQNLQQN